MKASLLLVLLIACGFLAYDDYMQRQKLYTNSEELRKQGEQLEMHKTALEIAAVENGEMKTGLEQALAGKRPSSAALGQQPKPKAPPKASPVQQPPSSASATLSSEPWPGEHFPQTRLRLLRPEELRGVSMDMLRYAINEMYARHGADFRDRDWFRTFSEFSWYHPKKGSTYDQAESNFTAVEAENLKILGQVRGSWGSGTGSADTPANQSEDEASQKSSSAEPVPRLASPVPRYSGKGRIYKSTELKSLVGQKLSNVWLRGVFTVKGIEDNSAHCLSTSDLFFGFTNRKIKVIIEYPEGVNLTQDLANALTDPGRVIRVFKTAKDPFQLVSVSKDTDGSLYAHARAPGIFQIAPPNVAEEEN